MIAGLEKKLKEAEEELKALKNNGSIVIIILFLIFFRNKLIFDFFSFYL